jgi:Transposase IS116/IS110/IS902 family
LEDLLEIDPRANENSPRPHRKLTTELDADPIKLFLGGLEPMNPQDPCPSCGRSGLGRARDVNFSAWIGLVPKQHSSGGKDRLGSISKQGDRYRLEH